MSERKLAGLWIDTHKAIVVKNHDAQNAFKFFLCSRKYKRGMVVRDGSGTSLGSPGESNNKI